MEGNNSENGFVRVNEEVGADEDEEILKNRIKGHSLYGLLIEMHMNCLKVGLGEFGETRNTTNTPDEASNLKLNATTLPTSSSDLDNFMESYCEALSKLKEAMEEAIQETISVTNGMYIQLNEVSGNQK